MGFSLVLPQSMSLDMLRLFGVTKLPIGVHLPYNRRMGALLTCSEGKKKNWEITNQIVQELDLPPLVA